MLSDRLLQSLVSTCVGRFDRYLVQQGNGKYRPVFSPLTYGTLRDHLEGVCTLASYVITEKNRCRFAVFDADDDEGLFRLCDLQQTLGTLQVPSYLEESRRGAHLWVFLQTPCSPSLVRCALLPFCPAGLEFFPAQDEATFLHPGYAVRVPLGVHRKSGFSYPFVSYSDGFFIPCTDTLDSALHWLANVSRVQSSVLHRLSSENRCTERVSSSKSLVQGGAVSRTGRFASIEDWCREQDPFALIGHYVDLSAQGEGHCPFGWHHSDGVDSHPSLVVYRPAVPDVMCWWCRAWKRGGSVFDFLRLYSGLSSRELWHRILSGEPF